MTPQNRWWQKTTIYQIYPRSFMDSNGDGIGDLRGIISKLDYIRDLGFETIWLSPFFQSPQQDWGYDVSDYYSVAPEYGGLADAEALIDQVHKRGMRVLFDLVLNHTSIQHTWFQESRSSRDHPKREWYIWRDGRGKRPPNNWKAIPGGSGWHYDETTDQWYYASFLPFQPDLNWRNPEVKEAMFDVVRYWLEKGVDGFRLDIFHSIYKDDRFRDNPFSASLMSEDDDAGFFQEWKYTINQPETIALAKELRAVADRFSPDRVLLGEVFGGDDRVKEYLGEKLDGLHLIFLWNLMKLRADASLLREVIRHYETEYPAPYLPVYVLGNHDQKRCISKVGNDSRKAKLLAMFQLTVRGVPVTYYGEEIGMAEVEMPARPARDPLGRRYGWVPAFVANFLGLYLNRDGCRTPMQWDGSANAGFCGADVTPWLPVHKECAEINVERELADENSILAAYKGLLHLRRKSKALQQGSLQILEGPGVDRDLLAYVRERGEEAVLVIMNYGKRPRRFPNQTGCTKVLLTIGLDARADLEEIVLPPLSGIVLGREGMGPG